MGYEPVVFTDFGSGLNLRSKADAIGPGEAIDAMNVVFTDRGAVAQRDGYVDLTPAALTNAVGSLEPFYTTGGTKQLLAGCGTRIEALSNSGAVVASATGLTGGTWDFARFGQPNAETAYAGNGQNLLRKWDGSAWSAIAGSPKAGSLAVTRSNRLVCTRYETTSGGPAAGISSPSHVYFSNAGAPEIFTASNYVILTPGDGEKIMAAISWREYLLVFKESKFFVFSAEGTGSDGLPIFDYRIVDTGVGLASPLGVVATERGVFFVNRRGVFVTTGGEPEKVSDAIDPIFLGGAEAYFTGGTLAQSLIGSVALGSWRDRIFVSYSTGGATVDRTLVYDTADGWWSLWSIPASSFATFRPSSDEELIFGYASGSNRAGRMNALQSSDAGSAISSLWRGGFQDLGIPQNKAVRQQKVWGSGIVSASVSTDYAQGIGKGAHLNFLETTMTTWDGSTWGGGTWVKPSVLIPRLRRIADRGTVFSISLTNSILGQPWSVHRIEHHIRASRHPAIRKTETAA